MLGKEVSELKLSINDCTDWIIVDSAWESESEFDPTNLARKSRLITVLGCSYCYVCQGSRELAWFVVVDREMATTSKA